MKKFFIIDTTDFDVFVRGSFDDIEHALKEADFYFSYLTKFDLKKRISFEVVYGEVDEYEDIDYDKGYDVVKKYF